MEYSSQFVPIGRLLFIIIQYLQFSITVNVHDKTSKWMEKEREAEFLFKYLTLVPLQNDRLEFVVFRNKIGQKLRCRTLHSFIFHDFKR